MTPSVAVKSVLVVDDHESVRVLLRDILEERGFQVFEAADGNEALKWCAALHFDVLIVDLIMPGREGIETIRELRGQQPEMKILAISGAVEGSYLRLARMLGANDTLRKPFDADTLVRKLEALLL
jgi:DNA-binding response OmpR family regulator